jgi:hypothetical protein
MLKIGGNRQGVAAHIVHCAIYKAMKLEVLLALSVTVAAAQTTYTKRLGPTGDAQLETSGNGVVILYKNQKWNVDLSTLPLRPDECEASDARKQCAAQPGLGCLPCVHEWQPVAWDKNREIFYLAAGTGTSHNRPWIILGYGLRTRKLKRISDYFGGGFDGQGTVSPSGKYLAYVNYQECGVCCTNSTIAIVDVQGLKSGSSRVIASSEEEPALVKALYWTGATTIAYEADLRRESDCRQGIEATRRVSGRLEVTQILK